MASSSPRVSVGIPVHNGENFLAQAIESILAQTYADLELIISDNASTDGTQEICQLYAARDRRVRYVRNAVNVGAAKNFNQLFAMAQGDYFKWLAHDDLVAPEFLERCVQVLDENPSIVLCHSRTQAIDEEGAVVREFESKDFGSPRAHQRFFQCVCTHHSQAAVFGLIRSSILARTRLIGSFISSDRVLLGELVLLGPFYELPEFLILKRHHPQQHWRVNRDLLARQEWYDTSRKETPTMRAWVLLRQHSISIRRATLRPHETALCYASMAWWIRRNWRRLARDVGLAARVGRRQTAMEEQVEAG